MIIPDKIYNKLKWVCVIVVPALNVFLTTIFALYHIPHIEIVVGTISAVATFVGALIGVSTKAYNKRLDDIED